MDNLSASKSNITITNIYNKIRHSPLHSLTNINNLSDNNTNNKTKRNKSLPSSPKLSKGPNDIDRYGFHYNDRIYNDDISDNLVLRKENAWVENNRLEKWLDMVGGNELINWDKCINENNKQLKLRIRKGIPEALRGKIWCYLTDSIRLHENNKGRYRNEFLSKKIFPFEETILRDIGRTFPKHCLFKGDSSLGQNCLLNVLKAYSIYDPEVGYCQGMGFITAMFLSYIPEEDAFWHLVGCMQNKKYLLSDLYRPSMPKLTETIYVYEQLLKIFEPSIAEHLEKEGVLPSMYASQWILTLFAYNFPFSLVTRIWDIFLFEGWKIFYRLALAFLQFGRKELVKMKLEEIMEYFQELPYKIKTEQIISLAISIPLTSKQIHNLQCKYHELRSTKR